MILFAPIIFVFLLAGCGQSSKAAYETRVKDVLAEAKKGIADSTKTNGEKSTNNKVTAALKKLKTQLEAINPPDDFFSGHSDIKEFVELTLVFDKQSKAAESSKGRKNRAQPDPAVATAAIQALDRAKRDMPFLSYELNDALGAVSKVSIPTAPPSGLNRGSPQSGQPPRPPNRSPNMRPPSERSRPSQPQRPPSPTP